MHRPLLAAAAAAALLLTGCSADETGSGSGDDAWTYTSGDGETYTADEVPTRIIAHAYAAKALMEFGIEPVGIWADAPIGEDVGLRGADFSGIEILGEEWGKIDVAALLWEIAPEARVQIAVDEGGLVVFGDEAELRRMLHVLMALGGDPTTLGAVGVSVKRDGKDIKIAVELGPDKIARTVVGVISASFGFPEVLAKLGIERRVYSAGDRKAQLDPFLPEDESDVRHLKELQKDLHAQFIDYVRSRRRDRLKGEEQALFSGDFWSGRQALELGLIDGIADLRGKMREKYGEKVKLRVVAQQKGWLQRRFGLDGRAPHWSHDVIGALDERALWARYGL